LRSVLPRSSAAIIVATKIILLTRRAYLINVRALHQKPTFHVIETEQSQQLLKPKCILPLPYRDIPDLGAVKALADLYSTPRVIRFAYHPDHLTLAVLPNSRAKRFS
jgi:hypothetical protein